MAIEEVSHSRVQTNDPMRRHFEIVYKADKADLSEGAGGWTGSGMPTEGTAYPHGTWTSKNTPKCTHVKVDPRETKGKCRIVAHFSGPKEF